MTYLYASLLLLVYTVSLVLTAIGLPGNWIMLATTALVAWLTWAPGEPWTDQMFHPATLIVALVLALVGELLEFITGIAGSKVAGGSNAGMWGALIGSMVGGIVGTFYIPIPLIGSLIGACLGAFAGALGFELYVGGPLGKSLRSGSGAAAGRLAGTIAKLMIGLVMWLMLSVAAFWP